MLRSEGQRREAREHEERAPQGGDEMEAAESRRQEKTLPGVGGSEMEGDPPCPSFPCFFLKILAFSPCEEFLVFLSVFPLIFQGFFRYF